MRGSLFTPVGLECTYGDKGEEEIALRFQFPKIWMVGALACAVLLVSCGGGGDDEATAQPAPTPAPAPAPNPAPAPDVRETSVAARAPVTWAGARTIEVRALAAASDGGVWATGIEVSPFPKPFLRYYRADGASRCGADGLVQLTNLVERFEKPQAFSVQVDHGGVLVGGLSPTGFFVSRYREADCSPDVQFGINGIAYLPHPRFQTASHVYMTKDPQGRILIGSTMRGGRMVVWRAPGR